MFLYLAYLILWCLSAQDLSISCPAAGLTVGVAASVACRVNKAAFTTACAIAATRIKFHFTPPGGTKAEWCASDYTPCPNTGTPDSACGTCGCGCVTDDGTFLTHRLSFTPTAAHDGGAFTCQVICFHTGALPTLTSNNCDTVAVGKLIL